MSVMDAINAIGGGGPPAAGGVGPPPTIGLGQPPAFDGAPPAPTGIGAMPTGNNSIDAKGAADQLILALRDASGFFPSMKSDFDRIIDQVKMAAKAPPGKPGPSIGAADASGAVAGSETAPTMESGSAGAM